MTIKEATKVLKDAGLDIQIQNEPESLDKETTVIIQQLPKAGIMVYEGTKILVDI